MPIQGNHWYVALKNRPNWILESYKYYHQIQSLNLTISGLNQVSKPSLYTMSFLVFTIIGSLKVSIFTIRLSKTINLYNQVLQNHRSLRSGSSKSSIFTIRFFKTINLYNHFLQNHQSLQSGFSKPSIFMWKSARGLGLEKRRVRNHVTYTRFLDCVLYIVFIFILNVYSVAERRIKFISKIFNVSTFLLILMIQNY